jgi:hypothetical protein
VDAQAMAEEDAVMRAEMTCLKGKAKAKGMEKYRCKAKEDSQLKIEGRGQV